MLKSLREIQNGALPIRTTGERAERNEQMSKQVKTLEELVKELPTDSRGAVRDFVEFLLAKNRKKSTKKLRQNWAGALSAYREKYTSLELQQKALDWRGD
jgi:hypothetical protein